MMNLFVRSLLPFVMCTKLAMDLSLVYVICVTMSPVRDKRLKFSPIEMSVHRPYINANFNLNLKFTKN